MMHRTRFTDYYAHIPDLIRDRLNQEKSEYLLQVDFDDYLDYLVKEAEWEPLVWDESAKSIEPFSEKRERVDKYTGRTYQLEDERFRIRIPLSPHSQRKQYFELWPSTTRLGRGEPEWKFEGDVLVLEVEASEQGESDGIDDVRFWLGKRNEDIEAGNKQLRNQIQQIWRAKRSQLEKTHASTAALLQKLNIPLHQDPNAKAKPVEIKPRQLRTVIDKPKPRSAVEPTLSQDNVVGLVDFIEQYVRQFEVTPNPYQKMDEEELRDLLVGMMNANYPGSTTGETFSKLGKTDITFRIDSGHVLICECKIWSGAKAYGEAIDQLFRYVTWRQNYGILLSFCKLKDMSKAVAEAQRSMTEHASYTKERLHRQSETRFTTRHIHPQDSDKSVQIYHLFVDLST